MRKYQYTEAVVHRFYSKWVFLRILKIHKKTPVQESASNNVADLKVCNFVKKETVKFENFFRTPILKNVCEQLLPLLKNIFMALCYNEEVESCINVQNYNIVGQCSVRTLKILRNIFPGVGNFLFKTGPLQRRIQSPIKYL